jgi:hypothetical protein
VGTDTTVPLLTKVTRDNAWVLTGGDAFSFTVAVNDETGLSSGEATFTGPTGGSYYAHTYNGSPTLTGQVPVDASQAPAEHGLHSARLAATS